MRTGAFVFGIIGIVASGIFARAEVKVVIERRDNSEAAPDFKFQKVAPPSRADAASRARFILADGRADPNSGGLEKLHDDKLPSSEDQPEENFFFAAGTDGGRLVVDLQTNLSVAQINSYSWHPEGRGPQVYALYASDGQTDSFRLDPKRGVEPGACGWKLLAKVDTRPAGSQAGGQYGVSISASSGSLGTYRYLLLDIQRTEPGDPFGNTFYSELDVIEAGTAVRPLNVAWAPPFVTRSADGKCEIAVDTAEAPDLKLWAEEKLAPVLADWYPKLVALLGSEHFTPPPRFTVVIRPGRGVAATSGARITANANWLKQELQRESVGALVHEEVHVIQHYGGGRSGHPELRRSRPPGWLVEGIPDYIRWFKFEPQSHGADLIWLRGRRTLSLQHNSGYRISANFLNYVVETYDPKLITVLNAACREGTYNDEVWKERTGKSLVELNDEWKTATEKALAAVQNDAPAVPR